MEIKDLAVNVAKLDEVRGGAWGQQNIYNGGTAGFSLASGGGVNSPTSSFSGVTSAHVNTQHLDVLKQRSSTSSVDVTGSQGVFVGMPAFGPRKLVPAM